MSRPDVITFGCRLNAYESEVIAQKASAAGLDDALIFNTCAVTAEATRQARQAIRKAAREHPARKIIVTGCAAQVDAARFAEMDAVDLVLGNDEKLRAESYAPASFGLEDEEKVRVNDIMSVTETAGHMLEGFADRTRAFVQIQNGCDHRCTFCVIPYGRGPSRSVPAGDVIAQITRLVENGYCEVILTGVDITAYGQDLPGRMSLGSLVLKILEHVPDLPRLRLSSIDSIEADAGLMTAFADGRVMPHVHLSLQSGDDMILKRMKRRHLRRDTIRFCNDIRAIRPDVVFGADIIAGFPTETEAMFGNSLKIIEECGLTYLHVFPFSARPGTPAEKMPQLPGDIVKARAQALRAAGAARLSTFLEGEVGQTRSVLAETERRGRTEHYAPVRFSGSQIPGAVVTARMIGIGDGSLLAGF